MSLGVVVPQGGLAGWRFLQRTMDRQQALQLANPATQRSEEKFRQNISQIQTATDLVQDREIRTVALQAFGLADDLDNTYFIGKVLEGGTLSPDSLANRLSDPRYAALSDAFGFGNLGLPRTHLPGFADEILAAFHQHGFEQAVGEVDTNLRLALGFERELSAVLDRSQGNDARWYSVMGSPPLRSVFEGALNLPASMGTQDVDRQLEIFKSRAESVFGTSELGELNNETKIELVRTRFLLAGDLDSAATATSPALAILAKTGTQNSAAGILQILGSSS